MICAMRCALVVLGLVACGSSDLPKRPPPPHRDAGADSDGGPRSVDLQVVHLPEPVVELPKLDSFTLLDPGKGERSLLRYDLKAGSASYFVVTKLTSRRQTANKWSPRVELPAMRDGFKVNVAGDPKTPIAFLGLPRTVVSGKTTPEADAYIASWHALLDNRRFLVALDPRDQLGTLAFADDLNNSHSADSKAEAVERLLGTIVPVPEEPIAIGAQWRVVTIMRQRPAVVKQIATYTLKARTATQWTIEVEMRRIAPEQTVTDPGLPKDVTADLVALVRHYQGTLEIDPHRPLPIGGQLSVDSLIHLRLTAKTRNMEEQLFEDVGTLTVTSSP